MGYDYNTGQWTDDAPYAGPSGPSPIDEWLKAQSAAAQNRAARYEPTPYEGGGRVPNMNPRRIVPDMGGGGVRGQQEQPIPDFTQPDDLAAAGAQMRRMAQSTGDPTRDQMMRMGRQDNDQPGQPPSQAGQDFFDKISNHGQMQPDDMGAISNHQPSGHVDYDIGGGMQSYDGGRNGPWQRDALDAQPFTQDRAFGVSRSNVPTGGGTLSMTGGSDDAAAYRRYRENLYGPEAVANEDARIAMAKMVAQDPLAREKALAGIEIGKDLGVEKGKSDIRLGEQGQRRNAYLDDAEAENNMFQNRMAQAKGNPALQQQVQERYQRRMEMLKEAYGFGAGLNNSAIYKEGL